MKSHKENLGNKILENGFGEHYMAGGYLKI